MGRNDSQGGEATSSTRRWFAVPMSRPVPAGCYFFRSTSSRHEPALPKEMFLFYKKHRNIVEISFSIHLPITGFAPPPPLRIIRADSARLDAWPAGVKQFALSCGLKALATRLRAG